MTGIKKISDGLAILHALEEPRSQHGGKAHPSWADFGSPVIDRGAYAIFPLAVAETQGDDDPEAGKRLLGMERTLRIACVHFFGGDGFHRETTLDAEEGYGRKLADAGASGHHWRNVWCIRDYAAVLVHLADQPGGLETLALHVMPRDWGWYVPRNAGTKREASRYRTVVKASEAADVVWSWPLSESAD